MSKSSTIIIAVLLVVIAVLGWILWTRTAEAPTAAGVTTANPTGTTGGSAGDAAATSGPKPLHDQVAVTYPKSGASVPKKFTVTGKAPGNWFFEASAPVMVQTLAGEKIAQGTLKVAGDWMTTDLVDFKGDISINPAYSGPATLVLLKDNPSGLPENEDAVAIPIVVQ